MYSYTYTSHESIFHQQRVFGNITCFVMLRPSECRMLSMLQAHTGQSWGLSEQAVCCDSMRYMYIYSLQIMSEKKLKMICRGFLEIFYYLVWAKILFWRKYELPWIEKRDQWRFPTKKAGSLFAADFFLWMLARPVFLETSFFCTAEVEDVAEFSAAFWAGAECRRLGMAGFTKGL